MRCERTLIESDEGPRLTGRLDVNLVDEETRCRSVRRWQRRGGFGVRVVRNIGCSDPIEMDDRWAGPTRDRGLHHRRYHSQVDANHRWSDRLAERLAARANGAPVGVVNAGVSSRILHDHPEELLARTPWLDWIATYSRRLDCGGWC
jgi:hypothetical protein